MKKRNYILHILLIISNIIFGQSSDLEKITGFYSPEYNDIPELEIRANQTFKLKYYDPIFPYLYKTYVTEGTWKQGGNEIILNPGKLSRVKKINLKQNNLRSKSDSLRFTINYFIENFENNKFSNQEKFDFDLLTIYINKKSKYYNIVQSPKRKMCGFARRIKNQIVIDSLHQFKIENRKIKQIGIYSYGFSKIMWFNVENEGNNNFIFNITHPIDKERMPRNKKIIIKRREIYFYERNGKLDTSWLANRLIKKE